MHFWRWWWCHFTWFFAILAAFGEVRSAGKSAANRVRCNIGMVYDPPHLCGVQCNQHSSGQWWDNGGLLWLKRGVCCTLGSYKHHHRGIYHWFGTFKVEWYFGSCQKECSLHGHRYHVLCLPQWPGSIRELFGDNLGCVTDEIGCGQHIVEFVSGGPNNYAYTNSDGKQTFKIGGITQIYRVQQQLTMDNIISMVTAAEFGRAPWTGYISRYRNC